MPTNNQITRNFSEAENHFRESLELFSMSESDNYYFIGIVKNNLAIVVDKQQSGRDEAIKLYQESLAIKKDLGDLKGQADVLNNLATLAFSENKLAEAERLQRKCIRIDREIGDILAVSRSLINLGIIAYNRGTLEEKHKCFSEAASIQRQLGIPLDQNLIDEGY